MSEPPPVTDAADQYVQRLAAMDLTAAQHVHATLLATTEPAEVVELARAYARVSRGLRQTLAFEARARLDRARDAREAQKHEAEMARLAENEDEPSDSPDDDHIDVRVEDIRDAVDRVISKAVNGDTDRHSRLSWLYERELADWIDQPDFLDHDLDDQILAATRRLDLPEALARSWRTLPSPTFFPEPEDLEAAGQAIEAEEAAAQAVQAHRPAPVPPPGPPQPGDLDFDAAPWRSSG